MSDAYMSVDEIEPLLPESFSVSGVPSEILDFLHGQRNASRWWIGVFTRDEANHFAAMSDEFGTISAAGNPLSSLIGVLPPPFLINTEGCYSVFIGSKNKNDIIRYADLFGAENDRDIEFATDNLDLFLDDF